MENLILLFLVLAAVARAWNNTQNKRRGYEERRARIPDNTPSRGEYPRGQGPVSQEAKSRRQEVESKKQEPGGGKQEVKEPWGRFERPRGPAEGPREVGETVPPEFDPQTRGKAVPALQISGPEEPVQVPGEARRRETVFPSDGRQLADAVIFAEVLGPPRAAAPWRPQNWRRSRS